jgi:hypothetical protein
MPAIFPFTKLSGRNGTRSPDGKAWFVSASAATAAMSPASMNGTFPLPVAEKIAPCCRMVSLCCCSEKFCMNQEGRSTTQEDACW